VLATNIDHVGICVSLAVKLDLARIERFLALVMSSSSGEAARSSRRALGTTPMWTRSRGVEVEDGQAVPNGVDQGS
jgi:hypothetical protein